MNETLKLLQELAIAQLLNVIVSDMKTIKKAISEEEILTAEASFELASAIDAFLQSFDKVATLQVESLSE